MVSKKALEPELLVPRSDDPASVEGSYFDHPFTLTSSSSHSPCPGHSAHVYTNPSRSGHPPVPKTHIYNII